MLETQSHLLLFDNDNTSIALKEPVEVPHRAKSKRFGERLMIPTPLINEHLSVTREPFSNQVQEIPARHRGSWQEGQELSSLQGKGGHKTLLAVSVLAPGVPVLPIKLWESHGCNEVPGTKVAITAQLNCHQHLIEAQVQPLADCKYLQIQSGAEIISQHAAASQNHNCRRVLAVWNTFRRCRVDSPVWLKPLWCYSRHPQASAS